MGTDGLPCRAHYQVVTRMTQFPLVYQPLKQDQATHSARRSQMRTFLRASALGIVMTSCILANAKAQDHPAAGLNIPRSSLSDAEQARAIALAEPQAAIS